MIDNNRFVLFPQSVDSQHPDVIAIQKLVERMKFGSLEVEQVDS